MRRSSFAVLFACALAACGPAANTAKQDAGPDLAAMQARIAALPAPYNAASYEDGRRVFAQCRTCHTLPAGAGHRAGPNLHGLFGRQIGTLDGFAYSAPLREADFIWDGAKLDDWLANPQTFLPGNRMGFAGVRDEAQRRDLIAYLMIETASE